MKGNNVLGVAFANTGDGLLTELTKMRAMASVPVGGRYRMVDFTLSNMVHAGMSRVGMITKSNYRSLMDHVGNGKSWDLARKNGGLSLLPPYSHSEGGVYTGRIDALFDVIDFIASGEEEYVLLCDCDVVSSIDIERVFDFHTEKKADITIVCKQMAIPAGQDSMTMETDGDARILDVKIGEEMEREAQWIASIDPKIPLHVTRFFPRYRMQDRGATDVGRILRLKVIAGRQLAYVCTGNC